MYVEYYNVIDLLICLLFPLCVCVCRPFFFVSFFFICKNVKLQIKTIKYKKKKKNNKPVSIQSYLSSRIWRSRVSVRRWPWYVIKITNGLLSRYPIIIIFSLQHKTEKKTTTTTKHRKKKTKDERNFTNGGYLGVNNIETGLHSQKVIFLQLQE